MQQDTYVLLLINFQKSFSKADLDSFRLALFPSTKSRSQHDWRKEMPRCTSNRRIPRSRRNTRFLQCRIYPSFLWRSQINLGVFPMRRWYFSIMKRVKGLTSVMLIWRFRGNGGKSSKKSLSWSGISRSTFYEKKKRKERGSLDEYLVKLFFFFSSLI